jgi:CRISPR/Cas system-associated exonuclease Cas4 (RecB family)
MKRQRLVVSVTELTGFQGCRRRWYLGRQYRQSGMAAQNLWFGTAVHEGLAGYWGNNRDPGKMIAAYYEETSRVAKALREEYGDLWTKAINSSFMKVIELGEEMLTNYVEYDHDENTIIQFRPLRVKKRYFVPLGDGNYLTGEIDLIAEVDGMIAVVDHKTSDGSAATGVALDMDEQLTGYTYIIWRVLKETRCPDEAYYDVLMKVVPEPPAILKAGDPTTAKGKLKHTTHDLYLKTLKECNLDPKLYTDVLQDLAERGMDSFFRREGSPRNLAQARNYGKRVRIMMEEMRRCIENPELAVPSPSAMRCPRCPFQMVCLGMEEESGWQDMLKTNFVHAMTDPYEKPERFGTRAK